MKFYQSIFDFVDIFDQTFLILSDTLSHLLFTSTDDLRLVLMRSTAISILKVVGFKFLELVLASNSTSLKGLVLSNHTYYLCFLWLYSTHAQQQSMLFSQLGSRQSMLSTYP